MILLPETERRDKSRQYQWHQSWGNGLTLKRNQRDLIWNPNQTVQQTAAQSHVCLASAPHRCRSSPSSSNFCMAKASLPYDSQISSTISRRQFLGGCKSILNTNRHHRQHPWLVLYQRKSVQKRKPRKLSDNPFEERRYAEKYWMNDAFVADCLNCFGKTIYCFPAETPLSFLWADFLFRLHLVHSSYSHYKTNGVNKDVLIV